MRSIGAVREDTLCSAGLLRKVCMGLRVPAKQGWNDADVVSMALVSRRDAYVEKTTVGVWFAVRLCR